MVSAAILVKDGRIFTGVSFLHFTGGPCAESTAIGNIAGAGLPLTDIVLCVAIKRTRKDEQNLPEKDDMEQMTILNPCGRCRQQLLDLSPDAGVVVVDEEGKERIVSVLELLPFAFRISQKGPERMVEG